MIWSFSNTGSPQGQRLPRWPGAAVHLASPGRRHRPRRGADRPGEAPGRDRRAPSRAPKKWPIVPNKTTVKMEHIHENKERLGKIMVETMDKNGKHEKKIEDIVKTNWRNSIIMWEHVEHHYWLTCQTWTTWMDVWWCFFGTCHMFTSNKLFCWTFDGSPTFDGVK